MATARLPSVAARHPTRHNGQTPDSRKTIIKPVGGHESTPTLGTLTVPLGAEAQALVNVVGFTLLTFGGAALFLLAQIFFLREALGDLRGRGRWAWWRWRSSPLRPRRSR